MASALLCLVLLYFTCSVEAQDTTVVTPPSLEPPSFRLLWYHWLAIMIFFALVVIVLAPSTICLVHYFRKTYAVRLANQGAGKIPPGYVLEKDLPQRIRDEVDARQMDTLFKHMDGDFKEIERSDISITNRMGIGEFGPILDAEVKLDVNDVQRAMIKVFQQGTSQDLVRFREEVESLKPLEHPQVAGMFGVVSKSPYYLIMELTINGDLKSFLLASADKVDEEGNQAVPIPKLVAMATDVASGLSYLECMEHVHKDVAARNCLVTEDLCIKIADFKVGRYLCRSEYAVQADGSLMPLRWMAPETILNNEFTLESTVWSFGVLLWEVMTRGAFPYSKLSDDQVVTAMCQDKQKLPMPSTECPDRVYKVMLECWSEDQYARPHMALAHKLLESSILTNRYDKSHVRIYS